MRRSSRLTDAKKTKQPPAKRIGRPGRPGGEDDDDVDSRGNIRGLIASEEEGSTKEEEEETTTMTTMTTMTTTTDWTGETESTHESTHESKPRKGLFKSKAPAKGPVKAPVKGPAKAPVKAPTKGPVKALVKGKAPPGVKKTIKTENTKETDAEETEDTAESDETTEVTDEITTDETTEDETDDETDTETETEKDTEDDSEYKSRRGGFNLIISDMGGGDYAPPKPKKYKLKNEPEHVRRFVKLVQTEINDEEDIDRDIGYFKGLAPAAQERLLTKLQNKVTPAEPTVPLRFQILAKEVSPEIESIALAKYQAMQNIDPSSTEYYKTHQWIQGYTQLPLGVFKDLPVKLEDGPVKCNAFMHTVHDCMESAIYGHDDAKLQIMQFVSQWIANPAAAGNVLSIHGPPGVGKTTLIKDGVAKALGRPFEFITLGGATDASYLDGHSYTYEGSVWGKIAAVLMKSKCMNPVLYFDELDKVSDTPKGEEINNLLIHLTDQSQNDRFQDKYFTGIDLNLSRCLFIFSHNNHEKVNPILRDRMYNIQVEGFNAKQKLIIAETYLVPQALREVDLFEKVGFNMEIVSHIIGHFTGDEPGVRELKRCIQTVISKLNMLRFYNEKAHVPFAIKGFKLPFKLEREHIDLFLKKKPTKELGYFT